MELNNSTNGMKEAQTMLGEQVSQMQLEGFSTAEPKPKRRAPRRADCWSMRVDLPMVRETATNANGDGVQVRSFLTFRWVTAKTVHAWRDTIRM